MFIFFAAIWIFVFGILRHINEVKGKQPVRPKHMKYDLTHRPAVPDHEALQISPCVVTDPHRANITVWSFLTGFQFGDRFALFKIVSKSFN